MRGGKSPTRTSPGPSAEDSTPSLAKRDQRSQPVGLSFTEKKKESPRGLPPRFFRYVQGRDAERQEPLGSGCVGAGALHAWGSGGPPPSQEGSVVVTLRKAGPPRSLTHTHARTHSGAHTHDSSTSNKTCPTRAFTSTENHPESPWLLGRDPPLLSELARVTAGCQAWVPGEEDRVGGSGSRN